MSTVFGIRTRESTFQTTTTVPDKHFAMVAGQIRTGISRTKSSIPILSGLPIIGAAFSSSQNTKANANVIMFVRPTILTTTQDYEMMTKRQEGSYRMQSQTEDFDVALENLKDVDDM